MQNGRVAKLLGIDVGTSGAKALLIDERGQVLRAASASYPLLAPKPLWTEQNPEDWWRGVCSCIREIGEPAPDAIGLTGQMHGAVFLDREGAPLRPAILWNDQRTVAESEEIDRLAGAESVRRITRNPPLTGFQAPKILWLRRNEPDNFAKTALVLLPKDYIRLRLSGSSCTDVSDASGTALFDVPARDWSEELFLSLGLPQSLVPQAYESFEVCSETNGEGGLDKGLPTVAGAGDQAAGAVGAGAVVPGLVSVSLGTSGVAFTALEAPSFDPGGAAHTFCHANGAWHAMGVMLSCGGALEWFRSVFAPAMSFDELAAAASHAPPGAEGLCFLPYLAGERTPHNDPTARGAFVGATLAHRFEHFARAVFEGVTFGLLDCMGTLRELGASPESLRVTGGGAKSGFWVQMLADCSRLACGGLAVDEGPAFGAAILAGVGIGLWPDVATACSEAVREKEVTMPSGMDYSAAYRRYGELYPSLSSWFSMP